MLYLVTWKIDIEAETPREAAEKARAIQLRPGSIATVFEVLEAGDPIELQDTIDLEDL